MQMLYGVLQLITQSPPFQLTVAAFLGNVTAGMRSSKLTLLRWQLIL
jgi:hypothetical protein